MYAGAKVYEKVWKQPEKTVGFYAEGNENIITKEEQASAMSEKEAREKERQERIKARKSKRGMER